MKWSFAVPAGPADRFVERGFAAAMEAADRPSTVTEEMVEAELKRVAAGSPPAKDSVTVSIES